MKLSQGVEWALHCTVLLAQGPPGTVASRRTLAEYYGLPEAMLAKHLKSLVKAGLLRATSGPKGGFALAREADAITVLEVLEAIEGSSPPFLCQEIRQRGAGALPPEMCASRCAVDRLMHDADRAFRTELRGTTVADIAGRVPARIRARARSWLADPAAPLPPLRA